MKEEERLERKLDFLDDELLGVLYANGWHFPNKESEGSTIEGKLVLMSPSTVMAISKERIDNFDKIKEEYPYVDLNILLFDVFSEYREELVEKGIQKDFRINLDRVKKSMPLEIEIGEKGLDVEDFVVYYYLYIAPKGESKEEK